MKPKRELLEKSRLYAIIDKETCANTPIREIANKLKKSETDIVQYRDKSSAKEVILKEAQRLGKIFSKKQILFIINDYLDIAKIADSDGVHLGQDDISLGTARKILGKDKLIGISCHSLEQAKRAQKDGADYISIGPVFASATKPEYKPVGPSLIKKLKGKSKIPFFAIGGIKPANLAGVLSCGAKRVALCSAVCRGKNTLIEAKKISRILHR
ncbi:MAG: thiamine phosphate synthase [Candidatus Omnitrophota bacterium]|jgi:thiamine-phosphate pyrophosphorylase